MQDFGKMLDKQDEERGLIPEREMEEYFHKSKEELRNRFFGKIVSNRLRKETTLLTGPQAENAVDISPFLYFYPTISIQICPNCPQASNSSILESYVERGLVSIFLLGRFSDFPKIFQKLAYEHPNDFIGPYSFYEYRFYSLNVDPLQLPSGHHEHYCAECLYEKINPHLVNYTC